MQRIFLPHISPLQICDGGAGEKDQDVYRHGDGGGDLHQLDVHGARLRPPLLRQERLVRSPLQELHGGQRGQNGQSPIFSKKKSSGKS